MSYLDTPLVTLFRSAGMRPGRAASIERWLDDCMPCGLSGCELASTILRLCKDYERSLACEEVLPPIARAMKPYEQLQLIARSAQYEGR
jgi:hypothetical protein